MFVAFTKVVFVGTVCVVLIPTKGIPPTSYVWIREPSACVVAFELNLPLVRVNWPIPTVYETISSPINASPVLTDMPPYEANGDVFATDTVVPSAVNADVVATSVVSGLTF